MSAYVQVPVAEWKSITNLLKRAERQLNRLEQMTKPEILWKTAKETGKTKEQLRYIRLVSPEKVKVAREGARSYLYNV